MATNIEQIFRSFVVNKFKEIQEENRNSENMDGSHNGELTAPGTEGASEGSSVVAQNEGSGQSVTNTEDTESKPMEITQTPAAEEKEGESKDLKTTDLSSDDEVKRDSSKKKSKKHKKHKSKKKKKKKKKEKNEKRSKSTSSVEDQENSSSESKSVWQPAIASPREQDTSNTVSSQMEEKVDSLPSLGDEDRNLDSHKEHPARPQLDIDSGFFGPKCPNEMHFSVSSNLAISEVEMPEQSKELAVDIQQNNEEKKLNEQNVKHTNCETAEALQKEMTLPHPGLELSEGKSVELQERVDSEENKHLKHLDDVSSVPLQPQSKSTSTSLLKLTAKSRSRSNSLAKEKRSRSKSLTKVPKKQASSKSLTRQRSRSSSLMRRRRSRSSSVGQSRRSKTKSPVRRRRSHSSTPARYSKSPIRSWWSKSIRNRQRSVSIERRRRSRTRSLVKRRRSSSRSSEKGRHSRTRSSAKRISSRSRSANRRKSRSTSRKQRLRSRSTSRRKSKSASPLRRQKSKTASPIRRGRSRSRSAVQKRRSRSSAASRRQKSRSGSGSRRRKSRSGSFTRRRRSRSGLASRRRKSRSGSIFRRRRSRSVVVSRRRRSRSPSISRKRRSRSLSASRRRRSRSASRRRRSRSASASRRRRSRSASRRRRSRSASRKRRSRSTSASRRRMSRSASRRRRSQSTTRRRRSASRRRRSSSAMAFRSRRSRSASRRRKSKSASASRRNKSRSVSRRRRSRSNSALRRRRSKSDSASRQQKSRFGSVSKTRKSRSGSDTRRPRSSSQQKSQSNSTTKRKSRSTSVSRGEQSTLQSSTGKEQSKEDRRSSSKGETQKSRSRSKSVTLKSLESEPTMQSKSSTEQRQLETVSASTMESVGPNISTVEKQDTIKLPDRSSTSVIESSQLGTSSTGTIPICTKNAVEVESNILDCSSTTSVLEDHKKSAYSVCPTEQIISTSVPLNENSSAECDMDIDPIPYTPIEIGYTVQTTEVVNFETSKELFDNKNDYTEQHTKLVDIRLNEEPEQKTLDYTAEEGTVCKPFSSSPNFGRGHGLSQLSREYIESKFCDERSGAVPVEDPSYHDKCENMESKPEFALCSDSVYKTSVKAGENSMSHVASSPNLKLSTIDSLLSCTELLKDSGSIKYIENVDKEVPEIKYLKQKSSISSAVSDCSDLTTRQDTPVLLAESQVEHLHSTSTIEGRSHSPLLTSKLDLLHNNQESIIASSFTSNEGQQTLSSVFPGNQKYTEETVSASMVNEDFFHRRGATNLKSPPLDEDNLHKRSESKGKILEASKSELLKNNTLAAEQSSSPDICISTETERSATSYVPQSYLLDNSTYDYNFKETGESEGSYPIDNKTVEVYPVKKNMQTLSSENICEDLGSTFKAEESSSCEVTLVNTSPVHGPDKINVHRLLKGDNIESTSMETNSAPKDAIQNSLNPPSSKEATTNIKSLTQAHVSSKLSSSPKINDSSSEKNPQCMSVPSVELARQDLPLLPEDKMEIQTNYEALSKIKNLESFSDECKIVSKPSPFNNVKDSCTKREVDEVLYDEAAQVENSANSIQSSKQEVIHNIGRTSSREQNSLSFLHSKKQGSSSSKTYDGNLERVQLGVRENELTQRISGDSVSKPQTDGDVPQRDSVVSKHSKSVSVSKSSKSDCLTNSTDDKVHVTDDSSQELSVKSGPGSRQNVYIQFVPKNKERVNLEKESSFQSLADLKQCELKIRPQSALDYSKPEPAYIGLKESKPQEDPKLLPKPFLHETGRLSVSSMPVQFKFSKTFKTLAVSQLCSASEDSSDVDSSKVNTSSSSVARNTQASALGTPRSSSKTLLDLPTTPLTANVIVEPSLSESSQDVSTELSQSDTQSGQLSEKDLSQPDNLQAADDSLTGSSTKPTFPHISNAASKLGVKQRQYRSRSVAQHSRTPSVDRGHASRSRSKSLSRRRRSKSKSSSRKKRSSSTSRKKGSHSKSVRRKRSRSRSRGRKGRSQSKSKGKKKRSTSKISGKRKHSRSKSSEKIGGSKSSGKQRSSRSTSKSRKNRLQSKSPEKKGRSRSKSESKKNLHSKTASTRKRSRSKSPNRRRKSRSKSLSRSRSRSVSASWKHFSHSKSSLHRKRSSSRSASPRRRSRSRNKRHSFSRSPAARSNSRSRSRWHRSRSRGRWRRSRSLSASRRRSRSTSAKKRKSLSPVRRRRSRSQIKQKEKSPVSKRKSTTPPPPPAQKKSAQPKPAGFKHSIGLKSLIQKQLSQAKSQGSTGKLLKEQIPLPNLTSRTQLSIFSTRTQASVSNLSSIGQIPIPNLAEVPLPSVSSGSQIPIPSVPPAEPLSVSSLAAETQLSVPDLTTANQWHVPDMSSTAPWSVPDIAAGAQWSMADLGTGTQWPMSDLAAASHWPMHDMSVGAQWSMPDLAAGTQWAVPDVASGAQWAVPDLTAGTQWTVPDLHAGSQWAMTNLTAGAQWAVPDLAITAQWAVPDLTAGAQIQRADLAPEAQVPGSDLAPEAQVPGSDLATEAQVPGSDLAAEAQVPGSDMVAEAQVPPEHDSTSGEHNVMPDVAAEALVPVASSTIVPDVAAGIPLPDVAVGAQMPVPDVAATIHMPDVATEAQKQMSNFVAAQAYISLTPEESVEDSHFREPILSSEHGTETGDAFVQESSFEPDVNTSLNLKMEESSGQQVPLVCFENSQSTELSDKTVLDKQDQKLSQGPETDLLNVPQVESIMDSESHLSSKTCSSSDIPIASCESFDYSGHSVSMTSDPSQEHSLFEGHKSSDGSLQCQPHADSIVFVESQTSPSQTEFVEPSDDHDQPLLAVKNSMADNLQVEQYDSSDRTLMEEPYSKSVCSKWVVPFSTPENMQNEPSINSNTTLDINSHRFSDPNEIEACVPNHSQQVDQNTSLSLPHPTEHYTSPEHPQLVEPYASPEHPQLVEPYTSPVHPQLVEPYLSPEHPPLVELYSSPEPPQLVEPYASPDFPQLVEPYSSPDHQQLVEPYTVSQNTQICQPSMSTGLSEDTCNPAEKPDECSISGHILPHAAVTCTQINTDSSSSDNSEVIYHSVAPDVPKKQDETDSDYPPLSKSNLASVSLQEVPCPSPLKASSFESSFSPKETSVEECSLTERQSVEPSVEYNLEHPTSPIQLLTEQPCSPHPANHDPQFPITDHKLDSPCISISQQLLIEEIVTDEQSKSEELSTQEDLQSHKDLLSSEQVQEKLYSIPVQSLEDFPSPSVPHTNEPCFNAADDPLTEYEHPPADDPRNQAENVCIPVLSNTINLHGGEQPCTIIPSPNRPEQETVAEHSLSEESKAASVLSNTIINLYGEDQSSIIIPSPNRPEQETVAEHSLSEESKAASVLSNIIINLQGDDQSSIIIPSPNRDEQETVAELSFTEEIEEGKTTSVLSNTIINLHGEDQSYARIPSPYRPEQETVAEHSLSEESKATYVLSNTIINLQGEDQSYARISSPYRPEQETVAEHSLSEKSKVTSVLSNTIINLQGDDQSSIIIPSPNRTEQETVAEHSLSEESKAASVLSNTIISLYGEDHSSTIISLPKRPEQETVAEHSLSEESKATSVLSNTIINLYGEDQSSIIIPSPNTDEQETGTEYSLSEESKAASILSNTIINLQGEDQSSIIIPSPNRDEQETVAEHSLTEEIEGKTTSVLSNTIVNLHGEDQSYARIPSPNRPEQETVAEHSLSEESKATSVLSNTIIYLHGGEQQCTRIPSPNRPEQETVAEHSLSEESKATSVLSNTIINLQGEDQSSTIIASPNRDEQETVAGHSLTEESKISSGSGFPDQLLTTHVDKLLDKPSPSSDSVMFHDSQGSSFSSPSRKMSSCPNSLFPEDSSDSDHSMPSEYSTKTNQGIDHSIKSDSPNISVFQSQEFDRCVENPLPTENTKISAHIPCLNQDKLQCLTSNQALDMSDCIKHKLEDSAECIKTENHFTTTPPDLLPYDSDQPTDMCSEPSSEPVAFNSQPPPELLPYDSEQPANSFLSISDYSTEQGSSDFHAPPELLPYDSDQPIVLHKQQTEPTAEELPIYDSSTIHHETYKALDVPSVDSEENCGNSASLNMQEDTCEPSNETINLQLNYVKEESSECSVVELPSTEHVFSSETVQGHSVPPAVVCTQEEDSSSSWFSSDKHLPTQQIAETEQPLVQTVLGSEIPEHPVSMSENQTEQIPLLTDISDISEVQCTSSELVNTSETATVLPSVQDEISLETAGKSPPPKSSINAECPQLQPVSRKTVPISDPGSRREHSRSRSIDTKESRSKSVSKNKRSRSKSATPTKKSHSKSLVKSRRSKSRSASTESNRRSPVVKKKESTKRSSRSASVGRRKRSRTSSVSPRKRSRSPSVGHKSQRRRSHSQSRQRHSRSPTEFHRQSRSPSVTRKKISPSPVTRRRRSPSPTRRRRSPSPPSRRRRSPSPTLRRRRTPSPASRRRHSPSLTRKRRSRSPSATRRRRSPSPSTTRRRRSPSPSTNRRRWSPSPSTNRRRRSPSSSATRKRRSPTPSATRRRRTPSPSASRRRRSPSPEFRKKRSPSLPVSHKRHSPSPSVPKKRRSRSPSTSRRKRSRSASQKKRSCSPSAPIKRKSKSKSPSKSPTGTQLRKRKTRSRSSSRDKKTVEKRRKRSSSKDSSKDYYSTKQRRKSRTPPRRKKSRSPVRRASVCKSPVRRRRSRSPVRRKSFSRSPIRRKRSRSRDKSLDSARSPKRLTDLDKAQLLEIAKANAAAMCAKAGVPLPPSLKPAISPAAPMEDKITQRTFGGTIQELTEKCKLIAQSKEDDVIVNKPHDSDDEEEDRPFYNHPFKVSEHKPISFSLLNPSLKPAPKNPVTLTKEFPVSSGSQHRKKESDKVYGEWVPVDKTTEESKDDVFANTGPTQPVDITSAMTERAAAQTRLTGNPYDIEALYMLNRAQEQIDAWAQSTSIPGQFTGSTGAQVLSAEEISNSGPQAWLKKDQFLKAAPVTGGRGALLMRKMGWKEGEGLGRNNEGNVDPILLDFKTDRKGLVADGEKASNKLALPAMKDLSGKHPISALMELCNKKKWSPPDFELVDDTGPEHRKRFLFRVTVNGVLCQPSQPSVTKKLAKATAAAAALTALGALPKESVTSTSNFCTASSSML